MKLPAADRAIIEPAKLHGYLLSPDHPVGRFKAAFFAAFGYTEAGWRDLERDLRQMARTLDAEEGHPSEYGKKYEVRGILTGPNARSAEIVTVWMVRRGERVPRFVTAYPGEET